MVLLLHGSEDEMIDEKILRREELAMYKLRELFLSRGYELYKAGKFDEYDMYSKYKDFLGSDKIISFTDTDGKLMALRPDVTLSLARNFQAEQGKVRKLCYNENVYRVSESTRLFREIPQTGVECMGEIGTSELTEVVELAARSLELTGENYLLELSHVGILKGLAHEFNLQAEEEARLFSFVRNKDADGAKAFCDRMGAGEEKRRSLLGLIEVYGSMDEVLERYEKLALNDEMKAANEELRLIRNGLEGRGAAEKVFLDASILNDIKYYSGLVFQGFLEGVPTSVLSGGRYDLLLRKMGKTGGAVGFAVYLDKI